VTIVSRFASTRLKSEFANILRKREVVPLQETGIQRIQPPCLPNLVFGSSCFAHAGRVYYSLLIARNSSYCKRKSRRGGDTKIARPAMQSAISACALLESEFANENFPRASFGGRFHGYCLYARLRGERGRASAAMARLDSGCVRYTLQSRTWEGKKE